MSIGVLKSAIAVASSEQYNWSLHFFKVDRRAKLNPYLVFNIEFRNTSALSSYCTKLCTMVSKFQVDTLEDVQTYNGINSKVSCDKLSTENELIADQWNFFFTSVANATHDKITGKYQGYIITGRPKQEDESHQPIVFVKAGNPVIDLNRNKSIDFTYSQDDKLESISEEVCRLYFFVDFIVIGKMLYTFSYKFEEIFNLVKTMQKLKTSTVDKIIETGAFINGEHVKKLMNSYKSARTFLSLNETRLNNLAIADKRREIAKLLKLSINSSNAIQLDTDDQASHMIKYLCYKIFQDKETDNIIEVTSVVNDNVKVGA